MSQRIDVMISSTARDLPAHRHEAVEACLRQGMYPIRMEDLPASASEAITVSLRMVDEVISLNWWGLVLAARGISQDAEAALNRALQMDTEMADKQAQGADITFLAQAMLWRGERTTLTKPAVC